MCKEFTQAEKERVLPEILAHAEKGLVTLLQSVSKIQAEAIKTSDNFGFIHPDDLHYSFMQNTVVMFLECIIAKQELLIKTPPTNRECNCSTFARIVLLKEDCSRILKKLEDLSLIIGTPYKELELYLAKYRESRAHAKKEVKQ